MYYGYSPVVIFHPPFAVIVIVFIPTILIHNSCPNSISTSPGKHPG